jgi:SagB-type dehydrogenase family enzyme
MSRPALVTLLGALLLMAATAASQDSGSLKEEASQAIKLPEPRTDGGISVEKALQERRSIRSFGDQPLALAEVSQLLWAAQGITDDKGHRTAPSAMEAYPLQIYLLASNVTGLPSGVYHYLPEGHNLIAMQKSGLDDLYSSSAGQEAWIKGAPAIFIITSVFERLNRMMGKDSSRFVYVEAGTAAENLLLEVVSLGLASTYTAGFDANRTEELLGLPSGEKIIGVLPVGRRA